MYYDYDDRRIPKMKVNEMLILCNMIDEYKSFHKNLTTFLKDTNKRGTIFDIYQVSQGKGKGKLKLNKVKKFYEKNKSSFDKISEGTNLWNFLENNYNYKGDIRDDSCIYHFYKYIVKNRDKLEVIVANLLKLQKLGFKEIKFDEQLSFDEDIYEANTRFDMNYSIVYLDNMQYLLNYEKNIIKYSGNGSHYKIILKDFDLSKNISYYGRKIIVNSLTFDSELLPEELNGYQVFTEITNLKNDKIDSYLAVRNSVDLALTIEDLKKQYEETYNTIYKLKNMEGKEKLIDILLNIKLEIESLEMISEMYDINISNKKDIPQHKLIKEKEIEKKKKMVSNNRLLLRRSNEK